MDLSIESAVVTLHPGRALRIRGAAGRRVSHVRGVIWVTQDGDPGDVVLENGTDLALARSGRAIVQALGAPALVAFEDGIEIERPAARLDYEAEARRLRAEAIAALLGKLASALGSLWKQSGNWISAARTRYELRRLSDHQLRDIGLRRTEIDCIER